MTVSDKNQSAASTATSAAEPSPPPVDPEDRPSIEPSDALPTEEPKGPIDAAKAIFDDKKSDQELTLQDATSGGEPTPPPVDPEDRPSIEPTDALPTQDQ